MRYQRVADILGSEPALKNRLGTKTEAVLKPNGDKVEISKQAVDLTERIHAAGHDANALNKQEILKFAVDVIVRGEDGDLPPVTRKAPEEAAPATNGEVKPKKKVVRIKKPRKKKAPEAAAVPEAAAKEPAVEEKPAPKKVVEPRAAHSVAAVSPPTQSSGNVPFAVGCAVNSNLIAASQLLEIHDHTAEGKEIRERLDKIIDEVQRRTIIPNGMQARA